MPRHVVNTRVRCSDCEHDAECTYVGHSGPPHLRFSASLRCSGCGLAQEADGAELSDAARDAFVAVEGYWVGLIRDFEDRKTEVLRALRTIRTETPVALMALLREGKPIAQGALVEVEHVDLMLQEHALELEIRRQ